MTGKDKVESILATFIVITLCVLFIDGRVRAEGFLPIAMYVVKKFFDGIKKESKGE